MEHLLDTTTKHTIKSPVPDLLRWREDFRRIMSARVRDEQLGFRKTWYLGALTLGTFTIQISTGLLLMLYYHPSIPQGYADMKDLEFVVSSGLLLRSLHRWSAHAMVFLIFVHMAKVFYRSAYRSPRELNWVVGVCMLILTLMLSYTGYLLPWDQLSYWGTTVGSNIISSIPFLGAKLRYYLLGGHTVNANALLRFYVLHTMILPLTLIALVAVHLWRLHRDGGMFHVDAKGNRVAEGEDGNDTPTNIGKSEKTYSYGDLLFREIIAIEALAVVLITIGLIWAAPLEQLANPMHTPNPAKAPWYFTGLQELLHYFPPFVAGIIVPILIVSGLIIIPFFSLFDEVRTRDALRWLRSKSLRLTIVAIVLVLLGSSLIHLRAWDVLLPLLVALLLLLFAARETREDARGLYGWLRATSIAFWIMTLFLMEAVVLTAVGTFFRGTGWSWVWPWSG